jgi:hypothetical protein
MDSISTATSFEALLYLLPPPLTRFCTISPTQGPHNIKYIEFHRDLQALLLLSARWFPLPKYPYQKYST